MKSKNILFYSVFICVILWTTLVYISFSHNRAVLKSEKKNAILLSARNYAEFILFTRHWNSINSSIYTPVAEFPTNNPFFEPYIKRDLITTDGQKLTLVNPVYMTGQLSKIANKINGAQFRLISLFPHNVENTPKTFEQNILKSFQQGQKKEFYREEKNSFYYLTALEQHSSCSACHENSTYDKQHSISAINIQIPYDNAVSLLPIARTHLLIYITGLIGLFIAFTQLQKAYNTIASQATTDDTTQIPNKRAFSLQFDREFSRNFRSQHSLALILCDIDYFKGYNDFYGHHQGDTCLYRVAQAIATVPKRPGDFCARYGGEEFILLLPETDLEGAQVVAEKIRQKILSLEIPHQNSNTSEYLTASFGISVCQDITPSKQDQLFIQADEALYEAKKLGRNTVAVFTKSLQE